MTWDLDCLIRLSPHTNLYSDIVCTSLALYVVCSNEYLNETTDLIHSVYLHVHSYTQYNECHEHAVLAVITVYM